MLLSQLYEPLFYFYNYDALPPTCSGLSMFPVLPALGLELSA